MERDIIKWEVFAKSAKFDENLKTLQGVEFKFYSENKGCFIIKADDALVKENIPTDEPTVNGASTKDEIHLRNNVRITGFSNSNIKCDSLFRDSISEIMYTHGQVEIEGGKWVIKGEGMEFSPSGDIITVKKDVTMEVIE